MFGFRLAEQAALASLRNAMEERGIRRLQKSIAECKKLKFAPSELTEAQQLLAQLEVRLVPGTYLLSAACPCLSLLIFPSLYFLRSPPCVSLFLLLFRIVFIPSGGTTSNRRTFRRNVERCGHEPLALARVAHIADPET